MRMNWSGFGKEVKKVDTTGKIIMAQQRSELFFSAQQSMIKLNTTPDFLHPALHLTTLKNTLRHVLNRQ